MDQHLITFESLTQYLSDKLLQFFLHMGSQLGQAVMLGLTFCDLVTNETFHIGLVGITNFLCTDPRRVSSFFQKKKKLAHHF